MFLTWVQYWFKVIVSLFLTSNTTQHSCTILWNRAYVWSPCSFSDGKRQRQGGRGKKNSSCLKNTRQSRKQFFRQEKRKPPPRFWLKQRLPKLSKQNFRLFLVNCDLKKSIDDNRYVEYLEWDMRIWQGNKYRPLGSLASVVKGMLIDIVLVIICLSNKKSQYSFQLPHCCLTYGKM